VTTADEPSGDAGGGVSSKAEKNGLVCVGGGGRLSKCTETVHVATERALTVNVQIAPTRTKSCQATMSTASEQRNTVARVEGTIDTPDCDACGGDYTIVLRVRDESGETKSLEFAGSWQRKDREPVKFATDYPIGENVDLLGVRSRGLRCVCVDAPPEPDAGDAPQGK
jgi:hypothetical protein